MPVIRHSLPRSSDYHYSDNDINYDIIAEAFTSGSVHYKRIVDCNGQLLKVEARTHYKRYVLQVYPFRVNWVKFSVFSCWSSKSNVRKVKEWRRHAWLGVEFPMEYTLIHFRHRLTPATMPYFIDSKALHPYAPASFLDDISYYIQHQRTQVFKEVFCHQPNEKHDDIWNIIHSYDDIYDRDD